ncbi:MAG: monofunctional biosynthetic peptidoglycan transglycosylase [Beijerinckiaceae bacterium]
MIPSCLPYTISRMLRLINRIIFIAGFGLAALVIAGMILPMASTDMIARWILRRPVERSWVPLDRISPHLVHAVIGAEDQRFCQHWGVDFDALRDVIEEEEGPSRGASTITMQTVKNVYLWHGPSYIRKAIEIPMALVVDTLWGKRRVMEVYLNVAEWGAGLYGAEAAAQRYFKVPAANLTPAQAARLAAALPNPLTRSPAAPNRFVRRVSGRMASGAALAGCVK